MLKRFSFFGLLAIFFACSESAQTPENPDYFRSPIDSVHAHRIESNLIPMYSVAGKVNRKSIQEMMDHYRIPGVSMAFVDNGQIAWRTHYGFANLADSIPVSSQTVFTGASLSKPITAIAALNLVEKGLLNLDEDVNLTLKEWKVPETELTENEKVTLRRLIGHNAGIKNDLWSSYLPGEPVPTLNQMLAGEPPSIDPATSVIFTPGSQTKYSNPGYSIIQKLLMDVRQEPFDQIIEELVFTPAAMENSTFKQPIPDDLMSKRAVGYTEDLEPYPYRLFPYLAAGGIWTTPSDLAQFTIALLNDYHQGTHTLISQQTAQSIFRKNLGRYVFSLWNWGEDIVFMHYGSNQGFNCFMYGSIEKNQGIVVMTNSDNAFDFFDYIQRAVNNEYQWEYVKPEILEPVAPDVAWSEPFLGNYQWRGKALTLSREDDRLLLRLDDKQYALTQTPNRVFVLEEIPLKITFPTAEGDLRMTVWGSGGGPARLEKITE